MNKWAPTTVRKAQEHFSAARLCILQPPETGVSKDSAFPARTGGHKLLFWNIHSC